MWGVFSDLTQGFLTGRRNEGRNEGEAFSECLVAAQLFTKRAVAPRVLAARFADVHHSHAHHRAALPVCPLHRHLNVEFTCSVV